MAATTTPKRPSFAIKPCTCAHEHQDKVYGKGRRFMIRTQDGYRCMVCGKDHNA